jgi:hypothetical protein
MKENRLLIMKKSRLLAMRSPIKPKPRASRPNQYWGTDMTKVIVGSFDWIFIHVVLDWYTKEIVGHYNNVFLNITILIFPINL